MDQMLREDLESRLLKEQSNKISFYDIVEQHPQKRGKGRFQSIHSQEGQVNKRLMVRPKNRNSFE